MSIDRILQLKLVTDVGDINRKMGQVEGQVGRVRGAFRGLRSFAGPIVITAALEGLAMLGDALSTGMADVREYDDAVFGLGQTLDGLSPTEVSALAESLTALGTSLGFGDDAALVRGLQAANLRLGDMAKAHDAVALAMDVARAKGIDFDKALGLVLKSGEGSARAMKELGTEGETARDRWADMEATFGGAAEAFAGTDEGMRQVMDAMGGDVWETFGGTVNDAIDEAVPALLGLWQEWQPVMLQIAEQVGPVFDAIKDAVQSVIDVLIAVLPHIQAAWDLLSPFVDFMKESVIVTLEAITGTLDAVAKALKGDFAGAWEGIVGVVRGVVNAIIGFWNALDLSLDFSVGNPAYGTIFDPVGSPNLLDVHTGDLIPDIPFLAAGGIVTRPTLAMLGEAGAEAVVPLDGRMGGDITINLGLTTDPASAGRAIVEAIQAYERRAGARWRSAA